MNRKKLKDFMDLAFADGDEKIYELVKEDSNYIHYLVDIGFYFWSKRSNKRMFGGY